MSGQAFDGFGDVIEGNQGIFSESDGLEAYDSVRHQTTAEGLLVECHCASCGFPRHLTIPWPELVALKYNVSPQEAYQGSRFQQFASPWTMTNSQRGVSYAWYPANLRCACGNAFMRPLISPGEVDGLIGAARQKGFLPHDAEKALSQQCFQIARQMGRV